MHFTKALTLVCFPLVLVQHCHAAPRYPREPAQNEPRQSTVNREALSQQRARAVKEAFQFAWDGYYQYAFPNDELLPVSNSFGNSRNGWGASAVDALSTAIIMEIPEIVNQIVDYVPTIDFSKSLNNQVVSVFETTIRYIGGMLSGYDFLQGPMAHLVTNKKNVRALLKQSRRLADRMSFAFLTSSGIPSNNIYFNNRSTDGASTNGIATIGTLILEWTRLSDLTGNGRYAGLVAGAERYLLNPRPESSQPWPGLLGTNVALKTGMFVDSEGGWVGGDDSFYEYLSKMYVYDSNRFGEYIERWTLAVDSSMANLASHPSSRPDLTYLARYNGTQLILESEHLACFAGGNWILGGTTLGRQDYVDFGLELISACHNTYTSTASRIGPEVFSWDTATLPPRLAQFYNKHGFWIEQGSYILRPEVIEGYYYAYRVTGDPKYQDWAWDAFVAVNRTTRTSSGFSSIARVNRASGGRKTDLQESFLFAELMKYSYMIQSPIKPWDFQPDGSNEWVFNTEGHPLRVNPTTDG